MSTDLIDGVGPDHEYMIPTKFIKNPDDMVLWENSIAYQEYLGFILAINEAIKGKSLKYDALPVSPTITKLCGVIKKLDQFINETPPLEQPQRFGNQAFRLWLEKVQNATHELLSEVLPEHLQRALAEVSTYFMESFGNQIRIDYGTGHEISFIMFLCCMFKIGALEPDDKIYAATRVFNDYLKLVRKLQQTYRMEPAGSHGVWSLDDYQFVPFIWGSSQLQAHPKIEPCSFLNPEVVETFADQYMFLSCIAYINQVKKGPFAEHSNQLWGISGVAHWTKVTLGLIKMYRAEVLGKFPVAQHITFGSLLPLKPFLQGRGTDRRFLGMTPPPSTGRSSMQVPSQKPT
ncbi:serine/threonine-protein phosphatase 2A activator-like [Atheta coriaria]|uniref:serine/threonine-protein phosphatase 2A activator-like n=1 Tax=Dalotia coriaria TaxID=877792 RepID=UPI0031F44835